MPYFVIQFLKIDLRYNKGQEASGSAVGAACAYKRRVQ
jgi:hypothetical protein